MNLRRFFLLTAVIIGSSAAAGSAIAQCGYGAYGGYGCWDLGRLYGVLSENVPYYAAFPPVYYSYPVPRSYGYSPFAYPPGVQTPEVEMSTPLSIANPFFHGSAAGAVDAAPSGEAKAPVDRTTSVRKAPEPLVVINPFVAQPKGDQDRSALQAAYTGQ